MIEAVGIQVGHSFIAPTSARPVHPIYSAPLAIRYWIAWPWGRTR